ncbi:PREDICTED: solute carrier family 22 member 10-like [Elephantulus edwardii]|uniref:solute carrier family 22 member 10-like n=1 Tax=Elephantulus edwardii TaxID=28737 RepID=UPI0003F0C72D|nr:PREDICTED: solute carrier family 22 member 10-like [Elephantulus edwardii]
MVFEDILDQVGGLGRAHVHQIIFIFVILMLSYPHVLLENFIAATPDHRCWVHILDNKTVSANDTDGLNPEALLRISIPLDTNLRPEKCRRFLHPQWELLHMNRTYTNVNESNTEPCVDGWVYDQSFFYSTIVTEWDLVCESQWLRSMAQFLLMIGSLVGGIIYSYFTDRFGRKLVFRWCFLQFAISETCVAFAPTFLVYCVLRFLSGLCITNVMTNVFLLRSEWTLPKYQAMEMSLLYSAISIGNTLLGGIAFAIQDWRTLQLAVSVPCLVLFVLSRWLIESARWLIVTNKLEEGLKLLKRVAHINGLKNIDETLNETFVKSTMQEELDAAQIKTSFFSIFRSRTLRLRICFLFFLRLVNQLSYYGLVFHLQHWGSNIYLLQVLFGVTTLLSRYTAFVTLICMGRRTNQLLFMSLMGFFILAATFVPQEMQILRASLAILGAGASACVSTTLSIHSTELTPTIFRATNGALQTIAARSGASLAPLLMTLVMFYAPLPWIIYGLLPFPAGFLVMLLPETKNQSLPNTMQHVENE